VLALTQCPADKLLKHIQFLLPVISCLLNLALTLQAKLDKQNARVYKATHF